jgi:MFS family permease
MLGLYMVLPVLSLYALTLEGATSFLTGMILGAYGLSQALWQIPMGHLSDRWGRRAIITGGLALFALGSLVAGLTHHISLLLLGRVLQGSGAVASAVVALAADLSPEHARTQAMARIGVWVGLALAVGLVTGPAMAALVGVRTLFLATAALALISIAYLWKAIPEPRAEARLCARPPLPPDLLEPMDQVAGGEEIHRQDLPGLLRRPGFVILCLGVFLVHALLTMLFVIMPVHLTRYVSQETLSLILAPAVGGGVAVMFLAARLSERRQRQREAFFLGVLLLLGSTLVLALAAGNWTSLALALTLFMLSLAILEPMLPALTTHHIPSNLRGTSVGVFHMSQFLGSFVGGPVGGAFLAGRVSHLFQGATAIVLLWALAVLLQRRAIFIQPVPARDQASAS